MTDDANVMALREAYRRWEETKGESVDSWMALIDDDIEFGSLVDGRPEAQFARTHRGKNSSKPILPGSTTTGP